MLVFLREEDGSTSEFFYEGTTGFVREIILTNRSTGFEMTGRIFFESQSIIFIDDDSWIEYEVMAILHEGY